MNKKVGFIGCGKMASAIIKGVLSACCKPDVEIKGSEVNCEIAELAHNRLGIEVLTDNRLLTMDSDVIFLATKPNYVPQVLEEIRDEITPDKLVVSIAAGVSTEKIENILGQRRVIRVMPNTPALVQEGMSGVCKGAYAAEEDAEFVMKLLSNIGKVIEVEESQIDIVTAISGSGPAFFYQVIEDMARAGEKLGLEYEKCLLLATQTALGSAKMVMNRGELSVQTLIDNVATKGGCTFVGIQTMKEESSDKLFYDVIEKTAVKANELGK
ncbi:TPA: pyrroline-5-carboxylate reductase [Candidatus Scatousia excrementigallinarum]|uniref:Pyrroline-5-carboxylate reductase n=1 Tax=Candidatus Scatousia excrementigallinarum TaxID=2840935 RepID=A0A9D1EWV4_9BACT|nr:pyrroline-5-carboxylate reductase [Candidatus Scatousia excrementigallinarum]